MFASPLSCRSGSAAIHSSTSVESQTLLPPITRLRGNFGGFALIHDQTVGKLVPVIARISCLSSNRTRGGATSVLLVMLVESLSARLRDFSDGDMMLPEKATQPTERAGVVHFSGRHRSRIADRSSVPFQESSEPGLMIRFLILCSGAAKEPLW